ncbi:prepilin peptidase [Photobacterium leiognathi]|uniref:prepilin peptidase n=1 Tax=Photobacterium leiognathi TaxID=553611 RepID=UPI002981E5CA|nr:prepilin peptidase [Photobacterium leiognathi]
MSLTTIIATGLGLAVGSFLNVVIYRLPVMAKRNAIKNAVPKVRELHEADNTDPVYDLSKPFNLNIPRSACPSCNHQITAIENIPVLSWLALRGKCRGCKKPISSRYPLIELLNAAVWGLTAIIFYNQIYLITIICLLSSTFICIIATKVDNQKTPNSLYFVSFVLCGLLLLSCLFDHVISFL